jgi:hypothetical protein
MPNRAVVFFSTALEARRWAYRADKKCRGSLQAASGNHHHSGDVPIDMAEPGQPNNSGGRPTSRGNGAWRLTLHRSLRVPVAHRFRGCNADSRLLSGGKVATDCGFRTDRLFAIYPIERKWRATLSFIGPAWPPSL